MHRVLHLSSTKFWERGWRFTSGRADPNLVGPIQKHQEILHFNTSESAIEVRLKWICKNAQKAPRTHPYLCKS
jgi:hypothetical protein